jgi:hypothetical protein
MSRCQCPCGCKTSSTTRFCVSCHWDMIDAASGQFLDTASVKHHAKFVERVEQIGPTLFPVLKNE